MWNLKQKVEGGYPKLGVVRELGKYGSKEQTGH